MVNIQHTPVHGPGKSDTAGFPEGLIPQNWAEAPPYFEGNTKRTFHKDMSLTPRHFSSALPQAVRGAITQDDKTGQSFRIDYDGHVAFIRCHATPDRQLGSLTVPRMQVEIELCGFTASQTKQFFADFDRSFVRMGG